MVDEVAGGLEGGGRTLVQGSAVQMVAYEPHLDVDFTKLSPANEAA